LSVYPNPFYPQANITFAMGKGEHVNVDIYNIKGEKSEVPATGKLKAGRHSSSGTARMITTTQ